MSLFWCRPREAMVDEVVAADADARARCAGSYSAWMRKAKSDQAKAKWLCSSTKRYFTIDFDSQIFFYSHAEGAKRISHPIRFKEITGAEQIPMAAKRSSGGQGCGFLLKTTERTFELHTASNTDAVQWITALNAAKEMGSVADLGFKSGRESPAETVNSTASTMISPHTPSVEEDAPIFGTQDDRSGSPPPPPEPRAEPAPPSPAGVEPPLARPALPRRPAPLPGRPAEAAPTAEPTAARAGPAAQPPARAAPPDVAEAPAAAPTAAPSAPAAPAAPLAASPQEPPTPAVPAAAAPAPSMAAPAEVSAATRRMAAAVANMQIPTVSAAAVLPAPKKQAEQLQDDGPGTYRIISAGPLKALPVSKDYARTSAKVGEVAVQQEVSVLEVAAELNDGRRRARIGGPAGWITLLDTNSGFRFALKQSDALAEPVPTAAAASAPPAPEKEAAAPAGPPARACPDGHPLAPLLTPGAGQCDGCQAEVPAGAEVLECGTCNWWLCRACAPREAPGSQVAPPAEAAPQPALRVTRSGAKRLPRLASPAPISEDSPRPASALAGKRSADSPSPLLKKTVSFDEKEDVRQIAARGEESPYSPTTDEQLAQEAEASQAPLPPPPPAPTGAGAAPQPPQEEAGQPEAALRITRPNVNVKRLPKLGGHLPRSPRRDSPLPSPPQAPAVGAPAAAGEPAELEGAEPSGWDSDEERPRRRSPSPAADASAEEQKMVIPEGPAVAMEIADPSGFDSDDAPQEKPVVTLARPASASKGGLAMEFDMGGPKAAVPKALAERLSRKAPAKRSGGKAGRIDPTRPADARKAALARRPAPAEAVSEGAAASSEEAAPVAAPTAALQATAAPAAPAPAEEPPASAAPAADAPAASTAAPAEVSAATQRMAAAVANMQIPTVSAASALPAPKKQAEQAQDDSPGTYRVISAGPLKALPVSEDYARTSAKVGEVAVQQEVSVLEVAAELNDGRRRARIGGPAGWITLLDTNSGFRFAMKQSDTLAEPAPPGEPAVKPAGMAPPGGAAVNPAGMAPPGGAAVKLAGMAPPGGAAVKPAGMAPPGGAAVKPAGMAPPGGAAVKPAGMAPPGGAAVKPAGMAPPAGAAVKPAGMAPPAGAAVKPAGMAPPGGAAVKLAQMAPAAAEASAPPVPE